MKIFLRTCRQPGTSYDSASRDEDDEEVEDDEDEHLPAELTRWKPFGILSFAKPEPLACSRSLNKQITHNLNNFF